MKLKFYLRGIGLGIIVTALVLHFTLASSDSAMSDEQIKQRAMELGMIENTVLKASAASENEAGEISAADAADNLENKDNKNTDNNNKDTASVGDNKDTGVNEKKPDNNTVSDNTVSNNTASGNSASENLASDSEANNSEINNTVSENVASNNSTTGTSSNDEKEDVKKEDVKKEDKSTGGNAVTDVAENANVVSVMVYAGDGSFIVAKRAYEAGLVDSAAEYDMYLCQNGYDKRLTVGDHKIPVGSSPEEIAKILTSATR